MWTKAQSISPSFKRLVISGVLPCERRMRMLGYTLTMKELSEQPLILFSPGSSTRVYVEKWFATKGLSVTPDIELGSIELLAEFARLGYGAAFISRSFVQEDLLNGKLFELELDDPLPPRSIGFAVRQDRKLSLAADQFVRMVSAQL